MTEPYGNSREAIEHRELIYTESYRGRKVEIVRQPPWQADGIVSSEAFLLRIDGARERFSNGKPTSDLNELIEQAHHRVDLSIERG